MNWNRTFWIVIMLMSAVWASAQSKQVIGKLGQTTERATIHASPSTKSRVFYRAQAFEYLIIRTSNSSAWLRVVLENGRFGYIQTDKVARLPYDVTVGQTQTRTASRPGTGSTPSRSTSSSNSRAWAAQYGLQYTGTPYKWGGNDPNRGIDCSAFVKYLYGQIGIKLPRTAAEQALVGTPIQRLEDLQPGDRLYFWENRRNKIGHTGVYLGNGFFVHSSSGRKGVATDDLRNPKWRNILVAARR
ncbi:MAG TPA: C40 family peptidase [Fimbriimonadaceae bacterium]|nr:C40 family peptidase [Fimbriimonadaceae bacterium]HRJ32591.1 C40 family peptidase [Fimbriimonadaceae bacterium]